MRTDDPRGSGELRERVERVEGHGNASGAFVSDCDLAAVVVNVVAEPAGVVVGEGRPLKEKERAGGDPDTPRFVVRAIGKELALADLNPGVRNVHAASETAQEPPVDFKTSHEIGGGGTGALELQDAARCFAVESALLSHVGAHEVDLVLVRLERVLGQHRSGVGEAR